MTNIIEKYKNENQRLTIILGSGFHSQGLGNNTILSNWGVLLSKLVHSNSLSGKYTLDFEKIIVNQTKNQNLSDLKQAHIIEKKQLNHIANFIKAEQKWVLNQSDRFNYPNIFNPKYVSDVISLNFDHVAEELCNLNYGNGKEVKGFNDSSFNKILPENSKSSIYQRTSYRKITDKSENEIRFWYPHGTILKPDSITLGINRYAKLVSDTMRIRDHYKKNERENSSKEVIDLTWYSQILNNPVVVFGASWCPKCKEELPDIAKLYSKWKSKGTEVVFIALEEDKNAFMNFVKDFPFLCYSDNNKWESKIAKDYYVFSTPTMFLIDNKREIILRPNSVKQMDAWVDWYLQE